MAAIGRLSPANLGRLPQRQPDPAAALEGTREIYVDGRFTTAKVYRRSELGWGSVVHGPAIVEQLDSTTLVLPGQRAETDEFGNLLITWENLQ
jgi:N-methylhydantoinase A